MAKLNHSGFTLIEIILVMAISSSLLMVAFVGQGQLRAQAQFDSAVNKLVSSIADAHNEANAAVNISGKGDGTTVCPTTSNPSGDYVFSGVAWVASGDGKVQMDYYQSVPQSSAASEVCVFFTQGVTLPPGIQINMMTAAGGNNPPNLQGGREIFVRKNDGGIDVCPVPDANTNIATLFHQGACAEGDLTLIVTDDIGRMGQIVIDKSGLAQRSF